MEDADPGPDLDSGEPVPDVRVDFAEKLKLYTIVKEYEALKEHVPSGVYLMPAFDDAYTWHGVVFVYRGSYANGVFRFVLSIPADYPAHGSTPVVRFHTRLFHPAVDPESGVLALPESLQSWDPSHHGLLDVVLAVHDSLYSARFFGLALNKEAEAMLRSSTRISEFEQLAQQCAAESRQQVYDNPPGSSIRFSRWHAQLSYTRTKILGRSTPMQPPATPLRTPKHSPIRTDGVPASASASASAAAAGAAARAAGGPAAARARRNLGAELTAADPSDSSRQ